MAATDLLLRPPGITGMRLVGAVDPHRDEVVQVSGSGRTHMECARRYRAVSATDRLPKWVAMLVPLSA